MTTEVKAARSKADPPIDFNMPLKAARVDINLNIQFNILSTHGMMVTEVSVLHAKKEAEPMVDTVLDGKKSILVMTV